MTVFIYAIPKILSAEQYVYLRFRAVFVIPQWIFLCLALSARSTGMIVTCANLTPILVFLINFVFLQEGFDKKKFNISGIVCFIVVLVSLGST